MAELGHPPVHDQDGIEDALLTIDDDIVAKGQSDQDHSSRTFGPWSSVAVAFPVVAIAELAFLLVMSRLFSVSGGSGSEYVAIALAPFILGGLVIWHVGLGLVMGTIFRTMPVLLAVWAGVLLGAGLDSVVGTSDAGVETIVILSLCVLFFVLPGYRVGAWLRAGRPRPETTRPPKTVPPQIVGAGLIAFVAFVVFALLQGRISPAYDGTSRPAEPADHSQTVTIDKTSISVEPTTLTPGTVDVELRWPQYSTNYTLYIIGPLRPSDEARLSTGDSEWLGDYFNGPQSESTTAEHYSSSYENLSGYLGRLRLSAGRHAWFIKRQIYEEIKPGEGRSHPETRSWRFFTVE